MKSNVAEKRFADEELSIEILTEGLWPVVFMEISLIINVCHD